MPAEAPPAPAAPPAAPAADLSTPPPAPPPQGEIHVNPATLDTGPQAPPAKKGSARERLQQDLQKLVKPQFYEQKPEPDKPSSATPEPSPSAEAPKGAGEPTAPAPDPGKAKPEDKKVNPWKLVDEYKDRLTKSEARALELSKVNGNPEQVKQFQTQIETLRKQNEELENEIRFTNYAKSNEFKTKYQEPYEKAWTRAVKELSEVSVTDPGSGQERPATVADLAELVNLPLGKARALADSMFGPFADDVMQYRKEIQGLFEQQKSALEEARNKGIARDREQTEAQQRFMTETVGQIKQIWDKANDEFMKDKDLGPLLNPTEGDEDGNKRLSAGFKLVDQAFSERSDDPKLSPEQRAMVVKRHAAVRLRAAAFGRVYAAYQALLKKYEAQGQEISQYRESVPGTGGKPDPAAPAAPSKAWDQIRSGLRKIAAP